MSQPNQVKGPYQCGAWFFFGAVLKLAEKVEFLVCNVGSDEGASCCWRPQERGSSLLFTTWVIVWPVWPHGTRRARWQFAFACGEEHSLTTYSGQQQLRQQQSAQADRVMAMEWATGKCCPTLCCTVQYHCPGAAGAAPASLPERHSRLSLIFFVTKIFFVTGVLSSTTAGEQQRQLEPTIVEQPRRLEDDRKDLKLSVVPDATRQWFCL